MEGRFLQTPREPRLLAEVLFVASFLLADEHACGRDDELRGLGPQPEDLKEHTRNTDHRPDEEKGNGFEYKKSYDALDFKVF
jgi:hypothetical protein